MAIEPNALYDKTFQERIAAHFVRCPRLLRLLLNGKVVQEDFDFPVIRAVILAATTIVKLQRTVESGIPIGILMDQLAMMRRAGGILETELPALGQLVSNIYRGDISEDYYYPTKVELFIGNQRIQKSLSEASSHNIQALPHELSRKLESARISQHQSISPLSDFKRTAKTVPVPTGLRSIDEAMNGGLGRKEYGILCAYTGVGKTTLGLNFGWGAALQGHKVCFATLELDEEKCRERLYSLVGRYPYNTIRSGDPNHNKSDDEIWREVEEAVSRNGGVRNPITGKRPIENFKLWDFSSETCSIGTLEEWTQREIEEDPNHAPSLLIIDWLLCLDERPGFDPRKMKDDQMRHKLQRYSDEISKGLARKYNLAVWATHQADAKAEGQDRITMQHAAEGKSVGWKCSAFLGVGASEESRRDGIFTVNASKMRDGRLFSVKIKGCLDEQRFENYVESSSFSNLPEQNTASADLAAAAARREGVVLPS